MSKLMTAAASLCVLDLKLTMRVHIWNDCGIGHGASYNHLARAAVVSTARLLLVILKRRGKELHTQTHEPQSLLASVNLACNAQS
jgi:hypothetical protein